MTLPRYAAPLHHGQPNRRRRDADTAAVAARRLTRRDRWLLRMLDEHDVLTTVQIADLAFDSLTAATHRMLILYRLGVVDRFRPLTRTGSAPWHYLLAPTAATLTDNTAPRRSRLYDLAHSPKLAHTVGTNSFFTTLARHARHHPNTRLDTWWSERRCTTAFAGTVRPDGYGRWRHHDRTIDFFVEYDTGTEPLHRLTAKLGRYLDLATIRPAMPALLFWLPNPDRETHLHQQLGTTLLTIAIATANDHDHRDPAGPVWQLAGASGLRRTLIDLTTQEAPTS